MPTTNPASKAQIAAHGSDLGLISKPALCALIRGKVQAIVFDAPTLQYMLATSGRSDLQIVGPVFRPEMFGIAVAIGSPLRKKINEALLEIYKDGTYEEIYGRWFAPRK